MFANLSAPGVFDAKAHVYTLSLKRAAKFDVEIDTPPSLKWPQVICASNKDYNALMAPYYEVCAERLLGSLPEHCSILTGVDREGMGIGLARIFNSRGFTLVGNSFVSERGSVLGHVVEVDYSKFDKSQGEAILLFECLLFNWLGMPQQFIEHHYRSHSESFVRCSTTGFSATTQYQRKSGDPWTFHGNSIVTLATIVHALAGYSVVGVVAYGDDSIVLCPEASSDQLMSRFNRITRGFNLSAKVFERDHVYAFSSFIVGKSDGRVVVVPDPVKFIAGRLGRRDIRNLRHMREYVIGLRDNFSVLFDYEVACCVGEAMDSRYPAAAHGFSVIQMLLSIIYSDSIYELWHEEPGVEYIDQPNMRLEQYI